MHIQLNTDHNIKGTEALTEQIDASVSEILNHVGSQVTRVEIHLSDLNGDTKTGPNEIRCLMEARLAGHQPMVVSYESESVMQAVDGAAHKLKTVLESTLARLASR
ncbi:MAG: HPF/RaiA family ribosome-associated protein [Gemmatimonadota bacterium]